MPRSLYDELGEPLKWFVPNQSISLIQWTVFEKKHLKLVVMDHRRFFIDIEAVRGFIAEMMEDRWGRLHEPEPKLPHWVDCLPPLFFYPRECFLN